MTRSPAPSDTPGDWPEDSQHENGQYQCACIECGALFIGHKRRVVCKACSLPSAERCDLVTVSRSLAERTEAMFRSVDPLGFLATEWAEALKNAAPHSVSAPTGELDGAPARGRNTAGGESSSEHAVAAPHEDAERYRWLRECEPDRRIEIMERAETPDLLDHHIDKGRAGL